jgi:hypothetical protein
MSRLMAAYADLVTQGRLRAPNLRPEEVVTPQGGG